MARPTCATSTATTSSANGPTTPRSSPSRERWARTRSSTKCTSPSPTIACSYIMLPGINPTGRRIAVPVVVVVGFEDGKVHHEHIYWHQATVLVQAGLLDPDDLPVVGSAQAQALVDQSRPKNALLASTS